MSVPAILAVLAGGVLVGALVGYMRGWHDGKFHELRWMKIEAEERKNRAFALASREHTELAQAHLLQAAEDVERFDALLSGNYWQAYDHRVASERMGDLIRELEGDPVNAYEQLGALVVTGPEAACN